MAAFNLKGWTQEVVTIRSQTEVTPPRTYRVVGIIVENKQRINSWSYT